MRKLICACVALLLVPAAAPAQEVFKEITSQRLEGILTSMSIKFNKIDDGKGNFFYDYYSKSLLLRLTNFKGKDLMIDVYLLPISWELANKWNKTAKFSRASLRKDAKNLDSVVLESNLDLVGGVTEDTIKHFIRSFDLEITNFALFSQPAVGDEEIYKKVTPEKLEKILGNMNIKYKKGKQGANDFYYDFTNKDNFQIRLTNSNGDDLMIDAIFPEAALAKVNAWNVKRHYIRAVLYKGAMPYTSLESNLDCIGGTSDSIIRYFISTFDVEVRDFKKHLDSK